MSAYNYCYANPVKYVDPDGRSTHTAEDGTVLKVFDDNDLGVYKHENFNEKNYNDKNTSAGGIKMGESLHSLSFADQSHYNKTEKVRDQKGMKIDFGLTTLTDKVQAIIDADPSLREYQSKAAGNGDWDLKSKETNGSLLYGKYASPRDAGNFAAGVIAQMSGIEPIVQYGYGAYNLSGNDKVKTALLIAGNALLFMKQPVLGIGAAIYISNGEDKITQRSINIGKSHIKNRRILK